MKKLVVTGAGPVGCLLALGLCKHGQKVMLLDRMPAPEKTNTQGRSINLALSFRGFQALESIGLSDVVKAMSMPMYGRCIHLENGQQTFQPYSVHQEAIWSVSREALHKMLQKEAKKCTQIDIQYETQCRTIDFTTSLIKGIQKNEDGSTQTLETNFDILFGTDGYQSAVRKSQEQDGNTEVNIEDLGYGYKEIVLSQQHAQSLDPKALHIWPRGKFMLIALPNADLSFTCTLFLPTVGSISFEHLHTEMEVSTFFSTYFKDFLPMVPDVYRQWSEHKTGHLSTVHVQPWFTSTSLLLGDAAHAIVPFYGQGLNAGLEDVYLWLKHWQASGKEINDTFESFYQTRKQDADAIAELALQNFIEMRDLVQDQLFMQRKKMGQLLEKTFPEIWKSQYSMVTFSDTPYHKALAQGKLQDHVLQSFTYSEDPKILQEIISIYSLQLTQQA